MTEQDRKLTNGRSQTTGVSCTHCDSANTEMIALFGSFHLASQYFCLDCGTPFAHVRWQDERPRASDGDDTLQ